MAGDTLAGTDPKTGIGYTVSYAKLDVSGQPFASAPPVLPAAASIARHFGSAIQPYMIGAFASGTTAYVAMKTWAKDRIALSSGMSARNSPLTLPTTAASVNDVIGLALPLGSDGTTTLTLKADGTVLTREQN